MELFLEILGYGFIFLVLASLLVIFIKLLLAGLDALTNNDD